jgi:hypothetical protein
VENGKAHPACQRALAEVFNIVLKYHLPEADFDNLGRNADCCFVARLVRSPWSLFPTEHRTFVAPPTNISKVTALP